MVIVETDSLFENKVRKIKDNSQKERIKKLIQKIVANPKIGKPMRYARKGTREIYMKPFRISYAFIKQDDKIVFLDMYHKDSQ